ncbi:MAG: response regulator [Rhodospirillaceae bacterium]|nr:MAG: response regulator [Rhodospirillaceae bacterium]
MSDIGFKDLHCLIVDDEPAFLHTFEAMLRAVGVGKVTRGQTGSDALMALVNAPRPVDVIMCDLNMPYGNGLQLLKAIRTGQVKTQRLDTCFILVSSLASPEPVRTAAGLDVSGYLIKPLSTEKVRTAIVKGRSKHFAVDPRRYSQVFVTESVL